MQMICPIGMHQNKPQLIIPYTLDANDMRFAAIQGFNSGDQFYSYLKDSFDALYAEGEAGSPKMLSIGLHCRLIGRRDVFRHCAALSNMPAHMKKSGLPSALILPNIGRRPIPLIPQ